MKRIGIDLGGTKTEIILTEGNSLHVLEKKRIPTQGDKGYEFILKQLIEITSEYIQLSGESSPTIGIGIPGAIDLETQTVKTANLLCLINKPLQADLQKALKLPIFCENDANCFALSEALLGAGKGEELVLGIIMGTGLGGGMILHQKIWKGSKGIAAEWGHSTLMINSSIQCWCGGYGHVESFLSGTGIQRIYKEKTGISKNVQEIYKDYENKESFAILVFEEVLNLFGIFISNLISMMDPNTIVLGGGVSNLPIWYTKGLERVKKYSFHKDIQTKILQNKLGDSSGVYGASLLPYIME